ncbi:hypothetical protein GCM10011575_29780 [Microlunatus endophyticus]|uniref:Uncharacterized protein n=1 Tax=Microlunatus endophyticus TaxID=1716077 RepID=A0A917SBJ7_9ACTN|nr:hypothetical protein GCM10011575_29780 [Microlunatus endophyticus]
MICRCSAGRIRGCGATGSSSLYGPSAGRQGEQLKFTEILIGPRAVSFRLEPRLSPDEKATDDLERHFYVRIEGAGLAAEMDKDAMTRWAVQTVATGKLSPEQRQSLPPEVRAAAEQEAKKGWWARRKARSERQSPVVCLSHAVPRPRRPDQARGDAADVPAGGAARPGRFRGDRRP